VKIVCLTLVAVLSPTLNLNRITSPSSGMKRSKRSKRSSTPPAPSTDKRHKIDLPQDQLDAFNDYMQRTSDVFQWPTDIVSLGDNVLQWELMSALVLSEVTGRLETTSLDTSVIPPLRVTQAREIVRGFDMEEFEEWKGAMQKGVKENDWGSMISLLRKPNLEDV
jgi:hypothetical protein